MSKTKQRIYLMIGPVLFVLCCLAIPKSAFPALAERAAIGTVAWMAFWWVTAPIDYAVTAFLPIAINALVTMCDMSAVISNYASETILLLLGASILTVSWEETGLDKRIAASLLGLIGDNLRIQLIFWFMLSTLLSAILPNAVVCATITPIAVSMLKYIGEGDIANSRIGSKLLLYIAYGAGLGGLTSPLGGAMNLVTVDYLQQLTGKEYMYASWVVRFLPIMIVLLLINIIFMIRDVKKGESLGGSREYFKKEYKKFPPTTIEEKISLALFVSACKSFPEAPEIACTSLIPASKDFPTFTTSCASLPTPRAAAPLVITPFNFPSPASIPELSRSVSITILPSLIMHLHQNKLSKSIG